MTAFVFALDILVFSLICASAWFWYAASRSRVRRISKHEAFDAADMNRLITAVNRSQALNARAALTTACAGMVAFIRLLADVESMVG